VKQAIFLFLWTCLCLQFKILDADLFYRNVRKVRQDKDIHILALVAVNLSLLILI
jgi:hypothetical protein